MTSLRSLKPIAIMLLFLLTASVGMAAQTLTAAAPYAWWQVELGSTTNWDVITVPKWARQCMIINEHTAAGTLYVGTPGNTGSWDSTDDFGGPFDPDTEVTVAISSGAPEPTEATRAIPLFSATASLPVSIQCTASPY
jgi:hypothetical protein